MMAWSGPPREIVDEPVPFSFREFSQKISERDNILPSDILRKASDIFNKLHGLKQIEKNHRTNIHFELETNRQYDQANTHVYKMYKKVDEVALKNLELIEEIIEHYKK